MNAFTKFDMDPFDCLSWNTKKPKSVTDRWTGDRTDKPIPIAPTNSVGGEQKGCDRQMDGWTDGQT